MSAAPGPESAGESNAVPIAEFSLIQRHFTRPSGAAGGVVLGIGDDCALLEVPAGQQLAVTIDTLVEGVHFFPGSDPQALGHKALAVSLSDLAAMGADPVWATLGLTLPRVDDAWLAAFSRGLFMLADRYRLQLVGGDTTRGPLSITLQCHGLVPRGSAITRSGASPGDGIWVSGSPGEAALALATRRDELTLAADWQQHLDQRLDRPDPRVGQGLALRGIASAAIDLSDGLLADLGHILERSAVGARVDGLALPLSPALAQLSPAQARGLVLQGGDDYELCITVPERREAQMRVLDGFGVPWTRIGEITEAEGLQCIDADGAPMPLPVGFQHFPNTDSGA